MICAGTTKRPLHTRGNFLWRTPSCLQCARTPIPAVLNRCIDADSQAGRQALHTHPLTRHRGIIVQGRKHRHVMVQLVQHLPIVATDSSIVQIVCRAPIQLCRCTLVPDIIFSFENDQVMMHDEEMRALPSTTSTSPVRFTDSQIHRFATSKSL